MASEDPPPKVYGFKEREFKRDNTSASAPVPTAKELAMLAGHHIPPPTKAAAVPKPGDPNDVHALLQQNRTVETKLGLDQIEIRKVQSRRKRDFWFMLLGGNFLIIGLVGITRFNPISVIFGLAGVVIFSLALTWIMWQVVGKY